MILSDRGLLKRMVTGTLEVQPLKLTNTEAALIDLSLGSNFKLLKEELVEEVIVGSSDLSLLYENYEHEDKFTFPPHTFVLATTKEKIKLSNDLAGRIEGRSSIGRLGLFVHVSSGFIDPGFSGQVTLEMYNLTNVPITIPIGTRICQLVVEELDQECDIPYGHRDRNSKYQEQVGATVSRIDEDK